MIWVIGDEALADFKSMEATGEDVPISVFVHGARLSCACTD